MQRWRNIKILGQKSILAILLTLPLPLIILGIQEGASTFDIFVNGGWRVFLYNTCILLLIPYYVFFLLGVGRLYLSLLEKSKKADWQPHDSLLIPFFAGAGIITLLGFFLGLLKLLDFWVCFPIFIIIIYLFFLSSTFTQLTKNFWSWITANSCSGLFKKPLIVLRSFLLTVVMAVLLSKGVLLELFKDGGLHQYFAYFAETRLLHSAWMDPAHPILYDYLAGRGQGVYLFLTGFTNQFTIQVIGAVYLVMIAAISRQVTFVGLAVYGKKETKNTIQIFLPDLAMLLVLTSSILSMEPARFHLQTGAFFLFLAWTAPLFIILKKEANRRWLFFAQLPVVLAFPISGAIFLAFLLLIFGLTTFFFWLNSGKSIIKFPLLSMAAGMVSSLCSLLLNWFYTGIPEIQPFQVFAPFILKDRFQQWSSLDLLAYLNSSQSNDVSTSSFSFTQLISNAASLFSYPFNELAANFPRQWALYYSILILLLTMASAFFIIKPEKTTLISFSKYLLKKGGIYGVIFLSFYSLKFLLITFIRQSSLDRMLLFMDVFPIITFFFILIFFIGGRISPTDADNYPEISGSEQAESNQV